MISSHAVLTCGQMSEADKATIDSGRFSGVALMERAGRAVLDVVLGQHADAVRFHVLCGPGNNGGDGYAVARLLAERGADVKLYASAPPKPGTDAALAAGKWHGKVCGLEALSPIAGDCVIDALFGAGFRGEMPDDVRAALIAVRDAGCGVVAVDLPSGINGDTGLGDGAIQCADTVTFYRIKPAHLMDSSRQICGRITVADIGVRAARDAGIWHNHPDLWLDHLPRQASSAYKYQRGHVAVFSGPPLATGASRLSAIAAAETGAGAVTLIGSEDALAVHAAHVTSIMLRACNGTDTMSTLRELNKVRAVVLGPGFGAMENAHHLALAILAAGHSTLVLDADGLTAFAKTPDTLFAAAASAQTALILTPHEGEFARLFPDIAGDETLGKWQKARAAALLSHAVIVLKGPDTVIASPDGRVVINTHATPALATAGSGDVLAGIIASLTAQGMAPFDAACAGVWVHGEAGFLAGSMATADRLPRIAGEALATLLAQ